MKRWWLRLDRTLSRLRPYRAPAALLIDSAVVALAWHATYLFRLGFERWATARPGYDTYVLAGVIGAYLLALLLMKVPQSLWRFAGFGEVKRLTIACLAAGVASAAVVTGLGLVKVPRAVLALHPVVSLMGLVLVRIAYRMLYEHAHAQIPGRGERRALVLGAGAAARLLLAGIHEQGWQVTGLLDDDRSKHGARIGGVPVLGTIDQARERATAAGATHVVVALPSASPAQRRRALDLASATGLPVLTVPSVDELRSGKSTIERLRDIEPEDLLGREPVQLDEAGIGELLRGRCVLITGAGGSIGSELCRQVMRYEPARLVLYELAEFNLYEIEKELVGAGAATDIVPLVGDVKDAAHLRAAFERWRPQVVFHAAAYKHVPLMEVNNAAAALRNNTLGTWHAARAAAESGVKRFVLVSTDKAVNPTNVMGATKRAAEMIVSALAPQHPRTRFIAVRFGNVLGSSGSVIPKFKEQIARGGPITVTHPEVIRYFMSIPEAAQLVLQAAAVGASGQVLVLDMGEPVKIIDLARSLIRLAGHAPEEIAIEFTGLRPGEKMFEELLAAADDAVATEVPRLRVARLAEAPLGPLRELLAGLDGTGGMSGEPPLDDDAVRRRLQAAVPEYRAAGLKPQATARAG